MAKTPAITVPARAQDISGKRYGRWIAIAYAGRSKGKSLWLCRCDCGQEKRVSTSALNAGLSKSCGCLKREGRVHSQSVYKTKTEYKSWSAMISRCYCAKNPSYKNYGGRGIVVCNRWRVGESGLSGFDCFISDMGLKPGPEYSLDRIDGSLPYSPENCKWSTQKTQQNNRRDTKRATINGVTKTVGEWASEAGIPPGLLGNRLTRGWPPAEALCPPLPRGAKKYPYKP